MKSLSECAEYINPQDKSEKKVLKCLSIHNIQPTAAHRQIDTYKAFDSI